jgi:hypothetical protein
LDYDFGVNDNDDSIGGGRGNDYTAQDYDLFDRVWHWMYPFTIIEEDYCRAIESCILIKLGNLWRNPEPLTIQFSTNECV